MSSLAWRLRRGVLDGFLVQVGWQIVDVEGQPFDPGMAATPLNIEDFDGEDSLIVDQMLEPIVMEKDGLVKTRTVTLRACLKSPNPSLR